MYSRESMLSARSGQPGGYGGLDDSKEKEMVVVVMVTHGEQPLIPLLSVLVTTEGVEAPKKIVYEQP